MTTPTREELAPNIGPQMRDYIDAAINEAIAKARLSYKTQASAMEQLSATVTTRLGELEQFERQVRSHLGVYVPEAP